MKTHQHLFNKICSFENLYFAYHKARRCKKYRQYVLNFSYSLENNLTQLQKELLGQSYRHGGYREFIVHDSKKRRIKAAPFRDRVVHHAVCNIIEPIFDKGFIYDSYACRKNKGNHRAIKKLEKILKKMKVKGVNNSDNRIYILQCDISQYFNSIDHKILSKIIERKIKDKKTLWLIKEIIKSSHNRQVRENLFDLTLSGIPIGNLTSQLFANIYLNELDQFMKHNLQVKYYIRYMDDFLILRYNKNELHKIKRQIQAFLDKELKLKMHPKKANVFPADKGINFLGYLIFENYRLLRKDTVKRFIKRTKMYQKRLDKGLMSKETFNNAQQSWTAYAKFGNSWRLRKTLMII